MEIRVVNTIQSPLPISTSIFPHHLPLPFPLLTKSNSPSYPNIPLTFSHKYHRAPPLFITPTPSSALAHDTLTTTPETSDASLAVKKKAIDVHADLKGTSIFLVGMNNAMKSSVGELIADVLRYYYFDTDNIVEEAAGVDPSGKSFRERDENGFRESETEVLKQLSSMGRLVVNAGNGAVQSSTNLGLLRHGISIWIDVPLDMVAKGALASFPDSFPEALGQLTKIYEENRAGYATADVNVSLQRVASKIGYDELEQVTAEDIALEVLTEIEKLTRVKKMMQEAGKPF